MSKPTFTYSILALFFHFWAYFFVPKLSCFHDLVDTLLLFQVWLIEMSQKSRASSSVFNSVIKTNKKRAFRNMSYLSAWLLF